jgi:UDP-4-keto-D-QuiNAc 4-reductase
LKSVLITGCSGFVGGALASRAVSEGFTVTGTSRQPEPTGNIPFCWLQKPDLTDLSWLKVLKGIDVVVHCAARVHQLRDTSEDPLTAFRMANVKGTKRLAKMAVQAGVKRFILLSTIKVNGDQTLPGNPFRVTDLPAPTTAYAISKWEAEQALLEACNDRMQWIIVRPPLVCGPAAKGNLALFERMGKLNIPLPLGHINNRRSLISLKHLTEFLVHCISCEPANKMVLIADPKPLTTAEIYTMVCQQASRSAVSITLPKLFQGAMDVILKRLGLYEKMAGSLEVDISHTTKIMEWRPPESE